MKIKSSDWELFKKLVPCWQERHIEHLNADYIQILTGEGSHAEKFWKLEACICRDKRHPGVVVEMNRDSVIPTICTLLRDEIITKEDLNGFSIELKEILNYFIGK